MTHFKAFGWRASGAALCALLLATSCFSPGEARPLRYYRVEPASAPAEPPAADAPLLRARHATAAGHLRERIAVRETPYEVELVEHERWTEPPLAYARRAVERELYEEVGLRRSAALDAPALDLTLLAFEAVRGAEPMAEVALSISLQDAAGAALLERTIVAREAISPAAAQGDDLADLARALSVALQRAAAEVGALVAAALRAPPEGA